MRSVSDKIKTTNILFFGIGGQGVLSASEICALAALNDGYHVKKSEVKGMAQRGGSVESYVRFGACVLSPLPEQGKVDILVCLYESEYPRLISELRKGGIDLYSYLTKAHKVVGEQKIFLNAFMLGVVSSFLPIKEDSWLKAINDTFSRKQDKNKEYFYQGRRQVVSKVI
ncbi:MAG: 2-oxoacid:acceptor oxidoreductase family protein [Candidatus Omnitrophica bacterium]|nr:2-oxoacid:acceptor oxidoreductase family protein [Candidatus Omnitrophota bacterium]